MAMRTENDTLTREEQDDLLAAMFGDMTEAELRAATGIPHGSVRERGRALAHKGRIQLPPDPDTDTERGAKKCRDCRRWRSWGWYEPSGRLPTGKYAACVMCRERSKRRLAPYSKTKCCMVCGRSKRFAAFGATRLKPTGARVTCATCRRHPELPPPVVEDAPGRVRDESAQALYRCSWCGVTGRSVLALLDHVKYEH